MSYIHVTVHARIPVTHQYLAEAYEASNIQEAATNQERWFKEGAIGLTELLDDCVTDVIFTGIED